MLVLCMISHGMSCPFSLRARLSSKGVCLRVLGVLCSTRLKIAPARMPLSLQYASEPPYHLTWLARCAPRRHRGRAWWHPADDANAQPCPRRSHGGHACQLGHYHRRRKHYQCRRGCRVCGLGPHRSRAAGCAGRDGGAGAGARRRGCGGGGSAYDLIPCQSPVSIPNHSFICNPILPCPALLLCLPLEFGAPNCCVQFYNS